MNVAVDPTDSITSVGVKVWVVSVAWGVGDDGISVFTSIVGGMAVVLVSCASKVRSRVGGI